jgi:hypothetical protein
MSKPPDGALEAARAMGANIGPPTMTRAQCEAEPFPHNHRCRFTDGFYCEDCATWVPKEDETWYFTNSFGNRQDR